MAVIEMLQYSILNNCFDFIDTQNKSCLPIYPTAENPITIFRMEGKYHKVASLFQLRIHCIESIPVRSSDRVGIGLV